MTMNATVITGKRLVGMLSLSGITPVSSCRAHLRLQRFSMIHSGDSSSSMSPASTPWREVDPLLGQLPVRGLERVLAHEDRDEARVAAPPPNVDATTIPAKWRPWPIVPSSKRERNPLPGISLPRPASEVAEGARRLADPRHLAAEGPQEHDLARGRLLDRQDRGDACHLAARAAPELCRERVEVHVVVGVRAERLQVPDRPGAGRGDQPQRHHSREDLHPGELTGGYGRSDPLSSPPAGIS